MMFGWVIQTMVLELISGILKLLLAQVQALEVEVKKEKLDGSVM